VSAPSADPQDSPTWLRDPEPMSTPDQPSAGAEPMTDPSDEAERSSDDATGDRTHRDDVTDNLPLPNDPVDATGLLGADDLNGEAPD
jgi:hypothetical protein